MIYPAPSLSNCQLALRRIVRPSRIASRVISVFSFSMTGIGIGICAFRTQRPISRPEGAVVVHPIQKNMNARLNAVIAAFVINRSPNVDVVKSVACFCLRVSGMC